MRTSKQLLKPIQTGYVPTERFSLRIQDGVEIYEHEAVKTCAVAKGTCPTASSSAPAGGPRLVIDENRAAAETFISKARSEISELTSLLRGVANLREA